MKLYCADHSNLLNTNDRTHRAGRTTPRWYHLLLPAENTRHPLLQKTTKTATREPTYNNEEAGDHILDPEAKTKEHTHAKKNELGHPQPKHTPDHQYQKTWHGEWQRQRIKLAQLTTQDQQCVSKEARTAEARTIMGDQPHGAEKG